MDPEIEAIALAEHKRLLDKRRAAPDDLAPLLDAADKFFTPERIAAAKAPPAS